MSVYHHYDLNISGIEPHYRLGTESKKAATLPPGIYNGFVDPFGGRNFIRMTFKHDGILRLDNSVAEKVLSEINQFLKPSTREVFQRYSLLYKRGILLHGIPGTGKTIIITQIAEEFVKRGGVVLFNPKPNQVENLVRGARQLQKDLSFMVVLEEFDSLLRHHESELLELMDGEVQIDNVVYAAATNYLNKVPERFRNRPSRFASVIEVGPPSAQVRKSYLKQRVDPRDHDKLNIDAIVEHTDGFTLDHLKDVILSVVCFNLTEQEACDKIRANLPKST